MSSARKSGICLALSQTWTVAHRSAVLSEIEKVSIREHGLCLQVLVMTNGLRLSHVATAVSTPAVFRVCKSAEAVVVGPTSLTGPGILAMDRVVVTFFDRDSDHLFGYCASSFEDGAMRLLARRVEQKSGKMTIFVGQGLSEPVFVDDEAFGEFDFCFVVWDPTSNTMLVHHVLVVSSNRSTASYYCHLVAPDDSDATSLFSELCYHATSHCIVEDDEKGLGKLVAPVVRSGKTSIVDFALTASLLALKGVELASSALTTVRVSKVLTP